MWGHTLRAEYLELKSPHRLSNLVIAAAVSEWRRMPLIEICKLNNADRRSP